MTRDSRPLFILSFRDRDALAAAAVEGGWRAVAARRGDGVQQRFAASGASVAMIDARDRTNDALSAVRAIGAAPGAEARALLVLVPRGDGALLDQAYAAGATHFLSSPFDAAELVAALRFAGRHAERASGGWVAEGGRASLGWRYDPGSRALRLTQALADLAGLPADPTPSRAVAALGRDRQGLGLALRRLASTTTTAFAHEVAGLGRVVEHLQRDPRTGLIHALVEPLGETPDASAALRNLFPRRSRPIASLARDLPAAIVGGEIDVLFQPQVDVADERIVGVEALARWRHPRLGDVGAEALFEAAARSGRAAELSRHLQGRALALAAGWPDALSALRIAINVTAADMADADFAEGVIARIDASGVARARVTIEVTEGELIDDLSAAAARLGRLRAAGCRVAIDDFGTGYSSLAYLNSLPLDYLKLDKAMVRDIAGSERDRVVVSGVIDMATSLGLAVIAEGVETVAQLDWLRARGCALYQGFLCAPPLDAAALAARIAG